MSFVYMDQLKGVSAAADKANANFPASFVFTDHPRQVWKSTDHTGTLTVQAAELTNGLYIGNTNAESLTITVKNSDGSSVLLPSVTVDLSGIKTLEEFMTGEVVNAQTAYWYDYGQLLGEQSQVVIDFTRSAGDGEPVECGVVWAGLQQKSSFEITNNFDDSYRDYSYVEEEAFNNGATYILPRSTARIVSCSLMGTLTEIDQHYKRFRHLVGPNHMPVRIIDEPGMEDGFFARFESAPVRKRGTFLSTINMTLIEGL